MKPTNLIQKIRVRSLLILVLVGLIGMTMIPVPIKNVSGNQNRSSTLSEKITENLISIDSVQAINDHIYDIEEEERFEVSDGDEYQPENATCKYISDKAYIFLKNGLPELQNFVGIGDRFDNIMFPIMLDNFAAPSDIDGNGRVVILYSEMPLGVGGYFSPRDLDLGSGYDGEIVYVNAQSSGSESTLIHELQHLVKQGYDPDEKIWFNEGCSRLSETLYDYARGINDTMGVTIPTGVSLLYWDYQNARADTDYAAVNSFLSYLYDQYGSANLSAIYQASSGGQKLQSKTAIMHILNQYFPTLSFEQLFLNWVIASTVDNKYSGNVREYYYEKFDCGPNPIRFPRTDDIYAKNYPYDETWEILPWETKIYQFRNFINPNQVNVSIDFPSDSQDHLFGVNIMKEISKNDSYEHIIESFMMTAENISEGFQTTYNASDEGFDFFYLTISHLDGGEGGYYPDIPSSEQHIEVNVMIYAGEKVSDTSTGTTTTNQVSYEIPFLLLFLLAIGINRKPKKD
ncbi:MAG: hypothetical protein ACFFAU_09220 [Candidatus Hodarchaeota archaeon]